MATHSSILAWKIPWTEAPRGLQSTGSHTVKHDWAAEHTHTHTQGKLSLCSPNSPYPLQSNSSLVSSPSPLLWSLCSPLILSTITSHLDAHNPQHVSLPPSISQTCLHLGIFLNCESDYFTLLIKKKKMYLLGFLGSQLQYKGSSVFIVVCEI